MRSLIVTRRRFLGSLASATVCAPAVVRASSLMAVSARFSSAAGAAAPWATTQEALALLQQALERRFVQTLFGEEALSAEADGDTVPVFSPVVTEARITALWELRTWFGPRGAPPQPFEQLPGEVQVALVSMFGARSGV